MCPKRIKGVGHARFSENSSSAQSYTTTRNLDLKSMIYITTNKWQSSAAAALLKLAGLPTYVYDVKNAELLWGLVSAPYLEISCADYYEVSHLSHLSNFAACTLVNLVHFSIKLNINFLTFFLGKKISFSHF